MPNRTLRRVLVSLCVVAAVGLLLLGRGGLVEVESPVQAQAGPGTPKVVVGPYLQNPTGTTMTVMRRISPVRPSSNTAYPARRRCPRSSLVGCRPR